MTNWLYRLIERLDGEKGWRIMPYKMAQRIKMVLLSMMTCLILSVGLCPIYAQDINVNKLADAIYKAEGSVKYPYGIKSINTYGDKVLARKICINTIRNNIKRFNKQTEYTDYITFLGSRYCPPSAHKLNVNWVKNVKYWLMKNG